MPKIEGWSRVKPPQGSGIGENTGEAVMQWKTNKGLSEQVVTVWKTPRGTYQTRQGDGPPSNAWDHIIASRHTTKEEARKHAVQTMRNWNFPDI